MLRAAGLVAGYGGVRALHGVDLAVDVGESVAVIGPNGAGKSTLLKAISGTVDVLDGTIEFDGEPLTERSPRERVDLGIVHVPQGRMVFKRMSVLDNLRLGAHRPAAGPRRDERLELVREVFPALVELFGRSGGTLSGGQQQMLAVARGIMACPRLLMLDEPSEGLAPLISAQIFSAIEALLAADDLTVVVVEQRAPEALELCDRAYVLESGTVSRAGPADELLADRGLATAYLGGSR